jgi:hypothetical protein
MTKFKDSKFFKVSKSVVKGAVHVTDSALIGGVVGNIKEDLTGIDGTEKGELDWNKLIRTLLSSTIPVILLIALLAGWVDLETLKTLLRVF